MLCVLMLSSLLAAPAAEPDPLLDVMAFGYGGLGGGVMAMVWGTNPTEPPQAPPKEPTDD